MFWGKNYILHLQILSCYRPILFQCLCGYWLLAKLWSQMIYGACLLCSSGPKNPNDMVQRLLNTYLFWACLIHFRLPSNLFARIVFLIRTQWDNTENLTLSPTTSIFKITLTELNSSTVLSGKTISSASPTRNRTPMRFYISKNKLVGNFSLLLFSVMDACLL